MLSSLNGHPQTAAVRADEPPPPLVMFPDLGVKRLLEEIRRLQAGAVDAFYTVLQFAGADVSGRSVRICVLSLELGERLGLPPDEIRDLEFSALLHDIGFLGLPAGFFRKPGLLSEEERRMLRRHPQLGEEVLGAIPGFERVSQIVAGHHERPDGSGYPAALRGSEIPVPARILAVAETFHAMMTDRSYRRRLPLEDAVERLRAGAGQHYDEAVVEELGRDAPTFKRLLADSRLARASQVIELPRSPDDC